MVGARRAPWGKCAVVPGAVSTLEPGWAWVLSLGSLGVGVVRGLGCWAEDPSLSRGWDCTAHVRVLARPGLEWGPAGRTVLLMWKRQLR